MKRENLVSIAFILIIWQFISVLIGNDIILPMPLQILGQMARDLQNQNFVRIVVSTLSKALTSFLIALILGVFLGILAGANRTVENFFHPFELMLKTIPNISYMFLLFLWLPSDKAVSFVIFFIIFPVFYANILVGMKQLDQDLRDVLSIYPETKWLVLTKVFVPQIYPYLKSAIFSTLSLSIKVGVMSEVLGQVRYGIGKEMYLGKLNLDMVGVFSWTIWIILIVTILERSCIFLFQAIENK